MYLNSLDELGYYSNLRLSCVDSHKYEFQNILHITIIEQLIV